MGEQALWRCQCPKLQISRGDGHDIGLPGGLQEALDLRRRGAERLHPGPRVLAEAAGRGARVQNVFVRGACLGSCVGPRERAHSAPRAGLERIRIQVRLGSGRGGRGGSGPNPSC